MRYTPEQIEQKVKDIVAEILCARTDEATLEAHFIEDLHGDSLDCVETIVAIEEEFDLEIADEDAEKLKTVGDAVSYVQKNVK